MVADLGMMFAHHMAWSGTVITNEKVTLHIYETHHPTISHLMSNVSLPGGGSRLPSTKHVSIPLSKIQATLSTSISWSRVTLHYAMSSALS
jgi:hypothetical protein